METRAWLFLTTRRIVRMFGIKSSMKRIVWWYFSWPACLVRSGKPWPCEFGPDYFGSRLDLVTGPQHQLVAEVHAGTTPLFCYLTQNASFPRSHQFSVRIFWQHSCDITLTTTKQKHRAMTVDFFFELCIKDINIYPITPLFVFQKGTCVYAALILEIIGTTNECNCRG